MDNDGNNVDDDDDDNEKRPQINGLATFDCLHTIFLLVSFSRNKNTKFNFFFRFHCNHFQYVLCTGHWAMLTFLSSTPEM